MQSLIAGNVHWLVAVSRHGTLAFTWVGLPMMQSLNILLVMRDTMQLQRIIMAHYCLLRTFFYCRFPSGPNLSLAHQNDMFVTLHQPFTIMMALLGAEKIQSEPET